MKRTITDIFKPSQATCLTAGHFQSHPLYSWALPLSSPYLNLDRTNEAFMCSVTVPFRNRWAFILKTLRMAADIVYLLRTLRLIIVERNNLQATNVSMQKDMGWILRNSFLFVKVSLSWEFRNVVSTRTVAQNVTGLRLQVHLNWSLKKPPGRDRNWLTGLPEIVVEETKFTKLWALLSWNQTSSIKLQTPLQFMHHTLKCFPRKNCLGQIRQFLNKKYRIFGILNITLEREAVSSVLNMFFQE